jgi:hypothetical protein
MLLKKKPTRVKVLAGLALLLVTLHAQLQTGIPFFRWTVLALGGVVLLPRWWPVLRKGVLAGAVAGAALASADFLAAISASSNGLKGIRVLETLFLAPTRGAFGWPAGGLGPQFENAQLFSWQHWLMAAMDIIGGALAGAAVAALLRALRWVALRLLPRTVERLEARSRTGFALIAAVAGAIAGALLTLGVVLLGAVLAKAEGNVIYGWCAMIVATFPADVLSEMRWGHGLYWSEPGLWGTVFPLNSGLLAVLGFLAGWLRTPGPPRPQLKPGA